MGDLLKATYEGRFESKPKRETTKERREREAVARETQRLQEQEAALKAWPERLMKNLERATAMGWSIYATKGRFEVNGTGIFEDTLVFRFGYTPVGKYDAWNSEGDWDSMETFERYLNDAEEAAAEAARKYMLRQGALAKLSAEEREALGL